MAFERVHSENCPCGRTAHFEYDDEKQVRRIVFEGEPSAPPVVPPVPPKPAYRPPYMWPEREQK